MILFALLLGGLLPAGAQCCQEKAQHCQETVCDTTLARKASTCHSAQAQRLDCASAKQCADAQKCAKAKNCANGKQCDGKQTCTKGSKKTK